VARAAVVRRGHRGRALERQPEPLLRGRLLLGRLPLRAASGQEHSPLRAPRQAALPRLAAVALERPSPALLMAEVSSLRAPVSGPRTPQPSARLRQRLHIE